MPAARLSMRKIKEILRLRFERRLSHRAIARSIQASPSTVSDCLLRAELAGVGWPLDPNLDESALEARLYPHQPPSRHPRVLPDFEHVHRELRRKGVTLQLLWQEYKQAHPQDGYQYSQFCERYGRFREKVDVVLRQHYRAGEKMFPDFSGDGIDIIDPRTGEVRKAELFVAVLGASNFTYAEAFESQDLRCWIDGHIHAFEYFEGVAEITVPDNTKTAVTHPCRYEPDINPTYLDMAKHYGTAVIPARVRKPRDKAKVEGAILISQRWILAALRNHEFFSIQEANRAIAEKREELNDRKFQKLDTTRRELWKTLDRPALQPLPPRRYEFADWSSPRVNIDYHIEIDRHYYSVPYKLVHKRVDARITTTTVEVFFKGNRVTSHKRSYVKGAHTTLREHMPKSHQRYVEWTPSRILNWAGQAGPATRTLAEKILESRRHPEQGFRSCLGLLRLGKTYGKERLEAACARALMIGSWSYQSVKSILKTGLDRQPLLFEKQPKPKNTPDPDDHENIRGSDYYQ
jgi:transposase